MNTPDGLRWGVAACALGAAVALVVQAYGTRSFGLRPPQAAPSASAWRGIVYAFGAGMSPAAKESTRSHPFVYALGVSYHLGIFTALATLLWVVIAGADRGQPIAAVRAIMVALTTAGTLGGVALLARRARTPLLRTISVPDDYVANVLTTAFIALAALHLLNKRLETAFMVVAMLLLAYAPLGKIRHCLFFFIARGHLGRHYGRRGTFPLRHRGGG